MFRKPTLFILGAGASHEVGMPLGAQLRTSITENLGFYIDAGRLSSGDPLLYQQFRNKFGHRANEHVRAARELIGVLPTFPSIDEALHFLSGRPDIIQLGKVGIVHSILKAEEGCTIRIDRTSGHPELDASDNTWFRHFFSMALSGITKEEIDQAFDQVTVVNFNYDRTLEHYLFWALQVRAGIPRDQAARIVNKLHIIRPYGRVSPLDWQEGVGTPFGGTGGAGPDVFALAGQIRTFTEQHETEVPRQIEEAINQAGLMVLVGLGFHQQNMQLLKGHGNRSRVYATMKGISNDNHDFLHQMLSNNLKGSVELLHKTASELLSDLRPSIMALAS